MIAAVQVDNRSPYDVFAEMGLALPDRLAAVDPGQPSQIRDIGPVDFVTPAGLNLSPAAAELADAVAELLSGECRPPLRYLLRADPWCWLRAIIRPLVRPLARIRRDNAPDPGGAGRGVRRRAAHMACMLLGVPCDGSKTAGVPEPDTSGLSALDKLAYRAMRPWADDELSQAIAAKAKRLARRHAAPIDERSRLQAIALAELAEGTGGTWHGSIGAGWQLEDFVQCWRFAAVLIMRQRHADWQHAPKFWRREPWPASAGQPAGDGCRARDGPPGHAPAGSLIRARFSRPPGPAYGPLAARIRAAAPAWEQSRAALDALGVLSSPRDTGGLATACAGIVACHPHTGPPPLVAASGGHVMSP
jgi:hypothetical protein